MPSLLLQWSKEEEEKNKREREETQNKRALPELPSLWFFFNRSDKDFNTNQPTSECFGDTTSTDTIPETQPVPSFCIYLKDIYQNE